MPNKEKTYRIFFHHKREITKWPNLKIDIYIKLTDEEKELMDRQQLQLNEQIMLETGWAKTISYTHMIEHTIKPSKKEFDWKILINLVDKNDKIILKKYMEQLLDMTEQNILTKR